MQRGHLSEILVNLLQNAREALGERETFTSPPAAAAIRRWKFPCATTARAFAPDKIERVLSLLHHQGKGHRPGPGHRQTQRRTLRRHRARGIGAWKRREIHSKSSRKELMKPSQMSTPLPPSWLWTTKRTCAVRCKPCWGRGYAVRAAESAEEALELLEREEFFMVITDARLGGMSGYEFLAKSAASGRNCRC
jgi:hypothetical protein